MARSAFVGSMRHTWVQVGGYCMLRLPITPVFSIAKKVFQCTSLVGVVASFWRKLHLFSFFSVYLHRCSKSIPRRVDAPLIVHFRGDGA